jgi:hypothetical protein
VNAVQQTQLSMRLNYFLQGDMVQASRPTLSEQALAIKPFWAGLKNDERNELLSLSLTALRQTASKSNATLPSALLAGLPGVSVPQQLCLYTCNTACREHAQIYIALL